MNEYNQLDKKLKNIRKKTDLFEKRLNSQLAIDDFYSNMDKNIDENDMMLRYYKLNRFIYDKNTIVIPVIITVIYGLLVNIIYNWFNQNLNLDIKSIIYGVMNIDMKANWGSFLIIILDLVVLCGYILLFLVLFFTFPYPIMKIIVGIFEDITYQYEYELKILDSQIDNKLNDYKKCNNYRSISHKKLVLKQISMILDRWKKRIIIFAILLISGIIIINPIGIVCFIIIISAIILCVIPILFIYNLL